MTLSRLLDQLFSYHQDAVIAIARAAPVSLEAEVLVVEELDADDEPILPSDYCELMAMWHAQEVWTGLKQLLSSGKGNQPTHAQVKARFVEYLENDA